MLRLLDRLAEARWDRGSVEPAALVVAAGSGGKCTRTSEEILRGAPWVVDFVGILTRAECERIFESPKKAQITTEQGVANNETSC